MSNRNQLYPSIRSQFGYQSVGDIFDNRIILDRLAVAASSGLTKPDSPGGKSFKQTSFG